MPPALLRPALPADDPDTALQERYRCGEIAALRQLMDRYDPTLRRHLFGACPNEQAIETMACEVWQEVAARLRRGGVHDLEGLLSERIYRVLLRWHARLRWRYGVDWKGG